MITNLLRRLQGRPAPCAPAAGAHAPAGDRIASDEDGPAGALDYSLDADSLEEHFLAWVFDLHEATAHDADAAEAAFAHLELVAQRFDVRRMPRLPALLPQLLAAMRRDDSDAGELADLLARDPTLAGEAMRVAGSAFYRRSSPPSGLQHAVRALGHDGLRHVVLGSVMRPILRGDARQPGIGVAMRLWAHSEATTWLCGRIAVGRCDPGEAQLAGIVAGTGLAALSRMVPPSMLDDAAGDPDFAGRLLRIARPLSARAAAHWHLPAPVQEALQAAQAPEPATNATASVLRAAERIAMGYRLIEAGWLPPDATWPSSVPAFDRLDARTPLWNAMAEELAAMNPDVASR